MTPDELRRLDNDICIIYEKGLKPIKANKFYYFKHPMAKEMARMEISHNDIGEIERGIWRKYNPYNPYVENKEEEKTNNLDIESLDDLFDDADENKKAEIVKPKDNIKQEQETLGSILDIDDAPVLPQDEEDTYDLQKELEAKFDELFGPLDDN